MNRERETGWEELRRRWQSEGVPPDVDAAARQRVERGRRRMLLTVIGEGLVVLGVGAWSVHLLMTQPDPVIIVTLLVFWTFAGMLIGFGIVKRRGSWAPSSESTSSYLRLSLERAERREQIARFALELMAVWFLASVGLLTWSAVGTVREGGALLPLLRQAVPILVLTFGVLGVLTEWTRRRARTDVANLEGIVDVFGEGEEDGQLEEGAGPGGVHTRGRL